jgi:hypothetical protein
MDDQQAVLVEKIRNVILEMIQQIEERPIKDYSDYISQKLDYDYTYWHFIFPGAWDHYRTLYYRKQN